MCLIRILTTTPLYKKISYFHPKYHQHLTSRFDEWPQVLPSTQMMHTPLEVFARHTTAPLIGRPSYRWLCPRPSTPVKIWRPSAPAHISQNLFIKSYMAAQHGRRHQQVGVGQRLLLPAATTCRYHRHCSSCPPAQQRALRAGPRMGSATAHRYCTPLLPAATAASTPAHPPACLPVLPLLRTATATTAASSPGPPPRSTCPARAPIWASATAAPPSPQTPCPGWPWPPQT